MRVAIRRRPGVLVPGLLAVAACGVWAGRLLLAPEVTIDGRSGDWRAVSEGLRRSGRGDALAGGRRAIVHVHDAGAAPAALALSTSLRDPSVPVRLTITSAGETRFDEALAVTPAELRIPVAGGSADVLLEAHPAADTDRPLYLVHHITLRRSIGAAEWLARAAPALLGIAVFLALGRRGHAALALPWSLLVVAAVAALVAEAADPVAWLQIRPGWRDRLRIAALVALWVLSLAAPPSRLGSLAAIWGTVGLLHGPTLRYGVVSDELLWARPWSWAELASTLWGPSDPSGWTGAVYRPIPTWTRALDFWLWGTWTAGYHLTSLALFALNGTLAWRLFARLGLNPRAALAGALIWLAHPLSASAATWGGQRTDSLMVVFYLTALLAVLAPSFRRPHAIAAMVAAALALACKEMAVTLPLAAFLVVRAALPPEQRRRRHAVLAALALLVAVYVCLWLAVFSGWFPRHFTGWRGFDARRLSDWARLPLLLYTAVFVPTGYEAWWQTRLREWPLGYLALGALVPAVLWLIVRGCPACGGRRIALLGLAWPLVTVWPILPGRPDVYRLGLLIGLGCAMALAGVAAHAEHRSPVLPALLVSAFVVAAAPVSLATAAAWGPGGFFWNQAMGWARATPEWVQSLHPQTRALFWEQLERDEHARVWMETGVRPPPAGP